jgi:hypothetical protein
MSADRQLQKLHTPIDSDVVKLLLSVIPQDWWSIRLEVEYQSFESGGEGYPMTISNNEGSSGIVIPPDKLYALIREHSAVFKKHGKQWQHLTYDLKYDEYEEDWKYTIDYKYKE